MPVFEFFQLPFGSNWTITMLRALLIAVAISAAIVTSSPLDVDSRINGGLQAAEHQFPYIVSIAIQKAHVCGGFIYNDRYVVTAASCVQGRPLIDMSVFVAQLSLITPDDKEAEVPVESVIYPMTSNNEFDIEYDNVTKLHDIALVKVVRPFVLDPEITVLRYEAIEEEGPTTGVTMGWGSTFEGGLPGSRLRYADVTILGTDCNLWGVDQYIKNYMICVGLATDNGKPCKYDEGSPVVQTVNGVDYAVGIVSKTRNCETTLPYYPAVYTRLSSYYYWIQNIAGEQPALA